MKYVTRIGVPLGVAVSALLLLAVVNRQTDFVAGFAGGTLQWLLVLAVLAGLVVAGVAVGTEWAHHSRYRWAARTAPIAAATAAACVFLFAQTYSPAGSTAAGFIGVTAIGASGVGAVAATIATIGSLLNLKQ